MRLLVPVPLPPSPAPSSEASPVPTDMGQLFRRFAPYVARVAGRVLGRCEEVDDVVQEVFLDAHRGLRGLRHPEAARQWLVTVTLRKARRHLRRRQILRFLGLDTPLDAETLQDASMSADARAHVAAVYRILDRLAPDVRIAWVMHRVEDEPLERVAEVCGCSRATAHRRITAAKAALEEGLRDAENR